MTKPRIAQIAAALALLAMTTFSARQALAAEKPVVNITGYTIDAELVPKTHMLTATAHVTFTALDDLPVVPFEMHGALRVDSVSDDKNAPLNGERGAAAALLVTPPIPIAKNQSYTWTFHYSGALENDTGGPVEGLKLAYVGDPISYLLYAGRWFPMTGYTTDRFTADIHVTVPTGYRVIGSGRSSTSTGTRRDSPGPSSSGNLKSLFRPPERRISASMSPRPTSPRRRSSPTPHSRNSPSSPAPSAFPNPLV
jgi:hypothetical protein